MGGWQVWEVKSEGGVRQLFSNVVMGSDVPVALHGGAALGVTFSRLLRPGAPHSAISVPCSSHGISLSSLTAAASCCACAAC